MSEQIGLFELANNGTTFLAEISKIDLSSQQIPLKYYNSLKMQNIDYKLWVLFS